MADPEPVSVTEIPTLSQWGLGLMALVLAFAALRAVRARSAASTGAAC